MSKNVREHFNNHAEWENERREMWPCAHHDRFGSFEGDTQVAGWPIDNSPWLLIDPDHDNPNSQFGVGA